MCASPFDFLRAGPPPPRVAILPDAVFFSRSLPLPAGATRAEVVAQVGVALESLSPFPLAQLYFGYYWPEGATRALAFASYRRRFTAEQVAGWSGAEHVMPAFASILGLEVEPATTVILSSPEGLTAVHWAAGPVPSVVLHQPLPPDAGEAELAQVRAWLIKASGGSAKIIYVLAPPSALPPRRDGELVFDGGGVQARLPADVAAALDVRDKGDLEALARARRRDVALWRGAVGALAACLLFLLAEIALIGAGLWQKGRIAKIASQKTTVAHIMEEQELAGRVDELSTKRLLPLEMISAVSPETAEPKSPAAIQFLRATTTGPNALEIEAQTNNAGEIAGYKSALEQSPGVDRVDIRDQRARDNVVTFRLIVTFKPGSLVPAAS